MSLKTTSYVLQRRFGNQTRKLLMIAIADYTGDDTGTAWAYIDTLAERAECSRRSVQEHLDTLEEAGELEIYRNAGPKGSHRFRVVFKISGEEDDGRQAPPGGADFAPPVPKRGATVAPGVQMSAAQTTKRGADGVRPVAPKTILTLRRQGEGEEREAQESPAPLDFGEVGKNLTTVYPDSPRLVGRELADFRVALPLLADLTDEDWTAHRAWTVAPARIRGRKLWPRDRAEFLANPGQSVELYRKGWKTGLGEWWQQRNGRTPARPAPPDVEPLNPQERAQLLKLL